MNNNQNFRIFFFCQPFFSPRYHRFIIILVSGYIYVCVWKNQFKIYIYILHPWTIRIDSRFLKKYISCFCMYVFLNLMAIFFIFIFIFLSSIFFSFRCINIIIYLYNVYVWMIMAFYTWCCFLENFFLLSKKIGKWISHSVCVCVYSHHQKALPFLTVLSLQCRRCFLLVDKHIRYRDNLQFHIQM